MMRSWLDSAVLSIRRLVRGNEHEERKLLLFGSYPIRGNARILPREKVYHFAVHYETRRYEITGDKGPGENLVAVTYSSIETFKEEFSVVRIFKVKIVDEAVIESFIHNWQQTHPDYSYYKASCQDFVRDFLGEVFDVQIRTQSEHLIEWAYFNFKVGVFFLGAFLCFFLSSLVLWILAQRAEELEKGVKETL